MKIDFTSTELPLLISDPLHIRYLSGFPSSKHDHSAWILITKKHAYFFTDGRYASYAKKLKGFTVRIISAQSPLQNLILKILEDEQCTNLFFEKHDLSYAGYEKIQEWLSNIQTKLTPIESPLQARRKIKTSQEIKTMRHAGLIAAETMHYLINHLSEGMSERELAFLAEEQFSKKNAQPSFDPLIAFDSNSATPHYNTQEDGSALYSKDSSVVIDIGAQFEGYCSDMTRSFAPNHSKAGSTVRKAYDVAARMLKPTTPYATVDSACRKVIEQAGFPTYQHATGHGVGLDVHEGPVISMNAHENVDIGHVVTIEPGIYIDTQFGYRHEDTLYIGRSGIENLTEFSD